MCQRYKCPSNKIENKISIVFCSVKLTTDFMTSEKCKKNIIEDGFKFRFKILQNDVQRWKCSPNTCVFLNE